MAGVPHNAVNSLLSPAEQVLFNILGGVLTAVVLYFYGWSRRKLRAKRFRAIFGSQAESFFLAYGSLIINPNVLAALSSQFRRHPFTKITDQSKIFSAETVSSSCEIRAASYLSSALGIEGRITTIFESDERLKPRLDIDFISLGGISNLKTLDALSNESNTLVTFDETSFRFLSKREGKPLFDDLKNFDYGIILVLHPRQFPVRTWITCAGNGEWGTSGSSWFLANKWREIQKRINRRQQFAAVIRVKRGQDESAELVPPFLT